MGYEEKTLATLKPEDIGKRIDIYTDEFYVLGVFESYYTFFEYVEDKAIMDTVVRRTPTEQWVEIAVSDWVTTLRVDDEKVRVRVYGSEG